MNKVEDFAAGMARARKILHGENPPAEGSVSIEEIAKRVRDAADELNGALSEAARAGLHVEADWIDVTVMGDPLPVMRLQVEIERRERL